MQSKEFELHFFDEYQNTMSVVFVGNEAKRHFLASCHFSLLADVRAGGFKSMSINVMLN